MNIELKTINVKPGQIINITIYSDNMDAETAEAIKRSYKAKFPNTEVMLFIFPTSDKIDVNVVTPCASVNICSDCSCGKAQRMGLK